MICRCVIDENAFYVEYVALHSVTDEESGETRLVPYMYGLKDGETLIEAKPPEMKFDASSNGFIKPKWNGEAWTESATEEEIAEWGNEHPAPVIPEPDTPDEPTGDTVIWDEMAAAIAEGVNEV